MMRIMYVMFLLAIPVSQALTPSTDMVRTRGQARVEISPSAAVPIAEREDDVEHLRKAPGAKSFYEDSLVIGSSGKISPGDEDAFDNRLLAEIQDKESAELHIKYRDHALVAAPIVVAAPPPLPLAAQLVPAPQLAPVAVQAPLPLAAQLLPAPVAVQPAPVAAQPAASACADLDPVNCATWAGSGQCATNPAFMLQSCQLSCQQCQQPTQACVDLDPVNCVAWAQSGQCAANPVFMLPKCQLSCQQCQQTPQATPASMTPEPERRLGAGAIWASQAIAGILGIFVAYFVLASGLSSRPDGDAKAPLASMQRSEGMRVSFTPGK